AKPHMVGRPEQRPDPAFPKIARRMRSAGVHVFPYTCALLWDVRNSSYQEAGGEAAAMRDREGDIVMARYGGQPLAMVGPGHPAYVQLMESVMRVIMDAVEVPGVYFDMFGTSSGGCYSPLEAAWGGNVRTLGMRELGMRYKQVALNRNPHFVMWMEGNADCYLDVVDGYISFTGNLPVRQALYADYVRPFGDKSCIWLDPPHELWQPARQFAWGAPIGRIFEHQSTRTALNGPVDPRKVEYFRELAALRTAAIPWLAYGRMLRPLRLRNIVPAEPEPLLAGETVPSAVWKAPDGSIAFVFANGRYSTPVAFDWNADPAVYGFPGDGSAALYRIDPGEHAQTARRTKLQNIEGTISRREELPAAGAMVLAIL
ncbi:MAG: DUF6259 domain-containing protein, partial [Planctomycetota bacterium]